MLLFYINFGDRNPPYPALGSNIPSARRRGQRFHFLHCRGSSPSLRFVNRHGGTLRRAGWVAFTKTYSQGKWLIVISHLPPTFAIIIHIPRPLCPSFWCPRVPYLISSSPPSRVPKSQVPTHASWCPRPTFIHSHFVVCMRDMWVVQWYCVFWGVSWDVWSNRLEGHLIFRDGAILLNWPQIASDRTIWGKSHNL